MNLKTFIKSMENLKEFYEDAVKFDKKIELAFGGDTAIMTDWWGKHLDESLRIIGEDMGMLQM